MKFATTFPCLMLLAELPTIEARYSRTTPPRTWSKVLSPPHAVRSPAPRPRASSVSQAFQLEQKMHGKVPAQGSQGCNYFPKSNLKRPNASTSSRLPSRQFVGAFTSSSLR